VHRRKFLASMSAVGVSAALPPRPAAPPGYTIDDVLSGRLTAEPLAASQLAVRLAAARADYRAACYTRVAGQLPILLAHAVASRSAAGTGESATTADQLARTYNITTELLLKMHDNGLARVIADRGLQAAAAGNDPLTMAESQRLAATVLRRVDHSDRAQHLVLAAAQQLRSATTNTDAAFSDMYGRLLAVAAYTAAIRDDRDTAWSLLTEAEGSARIAGQSPSFNENEIAVYRISVARKLGDHGAAVDYARKVDPRSITDGERRARYWEDTALALHGRGRHGPAFDALLAAERDVPEEVRCRPWAQQLTRDLLSAPANYRLSGVRDFASRVGVV
jgi:hypothetical protein